MTSKAVFGEDGRSKNVSEIATQIVSCTFIRSEDKVQNVYVGMSDCFALLMLYVPIYFWNPNVKFASGNLNLTLTIFDFIS